jgi:hypothetical protein
MNSLPLFKLLSAGLLLASCADLPSDPPPDRDEDRGYARSPHEFRDEMLTPAR